jgi:alpha-beta hydrolase superfamily lysophospholipase
VTSHIKGAPNNGCWGSPGPDVWKGLLGDQEHRNELAVSACAIHIAGVIGTLVSAGFTVYGNDHRGHGRTAPSAAHLGDFGKGGFDLLVKDMVRLSCIAKKENPNVPFILLGHGMGSFASQQHVLEYSREIVGLILSGPALDGLARVASSAPPGTSILNAAFELACALQLIG